MATVGELVVQMRASTAAFSRDLDKASQMAFNSSREIGRSFTIMSNMLRAAAVATVTSLGYMFDKVTESAHQIELASQRTAMTVEAYQEFSAAARLAGVETEKFISIIGRMAKNLYAAQTGNEKMAAAFKLAMGGLDVSKIKTVDEVLLRMADTFSKVKDTDFNKLGLGLTVMGKGSQEMLPFLNQGARQIAEVIARLREFGIIIDEQSIRALAGERENIELLEMAFDSLQKQIIIALLPAFRDVIKWTMDMAKSGDLKKFADEAVVAFKALAVAVIETGTEIRNLVADYRLLAQTKVAVTNLLNEAQKPWESAGNPIEQLKNFWKQLPSLSEYNAEIEKNYKDAKERIDRIWSGGGTTGGATATGVVSNLKDLVVTAKEAISVYDRLIQKENERALTLQYGAKYAEIYRLQMQGLTNEQIKNLQAYQAFNDLRESAHGALMAIDPVRHSVEQLDTSLQEMREIGFRAWEDTLTPLNRQYMKIQQLKELIRMEVIPAYKAWWEEALKGAEAAYAVMLNEGHKTLEHTRDLVDRLQKSFVKAFGDAVFGADSFGDAMGNMLIEMGKMIFEITIMVPLVEKLTNALRGGFGGGGGGGFLSRLFGGIFDLFGGVGMAAGGSIGAGETRLVGEKGPELFTPNTSGMITPNGAFGQVVYNIDARGADAGVEERIRRAIRESENRAVDRSVMATRELSLRKAG